LVDDAATIACDIGSHYIYMARHFRGYQPRRVLTRLGLHFTHIILRDNAHDMVAFQEIAKYN
jgi:acetolactate synthase-1/2/3 large subunit